MEGVPKCKLRPWERYDYDHDYSPPMRIIKNIYDDDPPQQWEIDMDASRFRDCG